MIEFKKGDILKEDAEAIVNTVNCVGYMGRGIALQFKRAYPDNFKAYKSACERNEVEPGKMLVFETRKLTNPRYIINFPTKRHWRGKARIEDIESGLDALSREVREREIRSIAIPPLGAGLGGLRWTDVRPRIERALSALPDVSVVIYEPRPDSDVVEAPAGAPPKMTPGRAALVGLMQRYIKGLLDPWITLIEVHKLMYFMQEADEPLRLRFVKAPYGPYAENLRHFLQAVEGYYVSGYGDGGDAPDKVLQLVPGAVEDAEALLRENSTTRRKFDRVAGLVEGFESPFGLELLATVHWVMSREKPLDEEDLIRKVYAWAERKRQFTPKQIKLAQDALVHKNWV